MEATTTDLNEAMDAAARNLSDGIAAAAAAAAAAEMIDAATRDVNDDLAESMREIGRNLNEGAWGAMAAWADHLNDTVGEVATDAGADASKDDDHNHDERDR